MNRLAVPGRRCLRRALHFPTRLSSSVVMEMVGVQLLDLGTSERFYCSAYGSKNGLVSRLRRYDPNKRINRKRPLSNFA